MAAEERLSVCLVRGVVVSQIVVDHLEAGAITFPAVPQVRASEIQEHVRHIYNRYLSLVPVLQKFNPKAVLDIGSGLGVIDIFLAGLGGITEIHLMDGDGSAKKLNSFSKDAVAWYSVELGRTIVQENVPEGVTVFGHLADPSIDVSVDMIISTQAWGHHFPVDMYIDTASRCLNPGGCIITDIRTRTKGVDTFRAHGFTVERELPSRSSKRRRFVFTRR